VRLRADEPAAPPPLPSLSATDFDAEELPLDLGSLEALHLGETSAPAAIVEMEVYREPKPAARHKLWILVGLAFAGLALAAGTAVVVLSNPS
jgi:hypothetical protein